MHQERFFIFERARKGNLMPVQFNEQLPSHAALKAQTVIASILTGS